MDVIATIFLLERGLVRCKQPDGRSELSFLLSAPRSLRFGRTVLHMFVAGVEFSQTLRSLGHEGHV